MLILCITHIEFPSAFCNSIVECVCKSSCSIKGLNFNSLRIYYEYLCPGFVGDSCLLRLPLECFK
uniref:Uncharacterized protein n=1 Tax=Rhizophora mucronata TaxID=61149 RepID=A0A2P2J1E3_RHIMU